MSRRILVPAVAVGILLLVGAAGAYTYFFSGLRSSPSNLALSSPSASTSPTGGAGAWQVASGSVAGYRVKEQFAGQTSTHEAVARTSDVSGQVTITQAGGVYQMTSATITVQLANVASVDQVAGYNVTNRDRIVSRTLDVTSYPAATFVAQPVALPAEAAAGQTVNVSIPGQLTVRGVTKSVTATAQLRVTGTTAQLAGSIPTNMTDFGIAPPSVGFTTVQPAVTIEFQVNLSHAS